MSDYIEKNEMSLLSHIIYTIYNTPDIDKMRNEILYLIRYEVPFNTANFFLSTPQPNGSYSLTDCVNVNNLENDLGLHEVIKKYMETCSDIDVTHWLCDTKKSITYRSTDFLSESALKNTRYYKEMFEPYGIHFAAQLVLAHDNICVGLLTLFRSKNSLNFTDKEIFFLDNLKDHLSKRLYQAKVQKDSGNPDVSLYRESYNLTNREYEVLTLLYDGILEEDIAEILCISKNTLRRHLYNLYNKLGIQHRWQLHFLQK
ncbi:helix-turn-helix transcriptional regulator [Anaerovorax odorimutans]|uniref:Helix-turn-helix transcriptional regulator n=1 Tax=Anaerovorax odorimutans TaxID=109327 RepID=A0ABT1RJ41_9FIRM|nr:helix-turn-helix transcriptional regulator [Anaerovorax odorimutans]MCQ4635191.1 helix-turn-helix transcriptional regulator [Anaerovorax odorimutans]